MSVSAPSFDKLDDVVRHWMGEWTVPGIAVGILNDGEVETHGYGVSSIDTEYAVRPDTLFQIGSISKIFTTTMIMILVDQGKVALDEPVSTYLPEMKLSQAGTQDTVVVRNLLTHTSGVFGDHFQDFGWGDDALTKYIDSMADLRQIYGPNELWAYTNSGFNLAGRIVEVVLDTTFEDAIREYIFEPLGMDRSFYFAHEAIIYPVSVGHTQVEPGKDEHEVARRWPIPRASGPAGSIISTVGDLLKFARFHMGDGTVNGKRILSAESAAAMQEIERDDAGTADAWGLGWQINIINGVKVIGHGGSTNGFQAHLDLVPGQGFALAILTNSGRGSAAYGPIVDWVLEHYCNLARPEPEEIQVSPEKLQEYAGSYNQPLADVTISIDGNGLVMDVMQKSPLSDDEEAHHLPRRRLMPTGQDAFVVTAGEGKGTNVRFIRNSDGTIRFVRVGGRLADRVAG